MRVKCIKSCDGVTLGEVYDARNCKGGFLELTNDYGIKNNLYDEERFEVVSDLEILKQDLIDYHEKNQRCSSTPTKEFENEIKCEKMKYKLVKKLSGSAIADTACKDEFEKFIKKFGYYNNVEWTKEVEDYCIDKGWIDFLFYSGYLNKNREIKGYFNDVSTWEEAIELLIKANSDFSGKFVEIDGDIYFHLELDNTADWDFTEEDQKLLT